MMKNVEVIQKMALPAAPLAWELISELTYYFWQWCKRYGDVC